MSYTPTNWKNGDVITKERLDNIENGIVSAHEMPEITAADIGKILQVVKTGEGTPEILFPEQTLGMVSDGSTYTFVAAKNANLDSFIPGNIVTVSISGQEFTGTVQTSADAIAANEDMGSIIRQFFPDSVVVLFDAGFTLGIAPTAIETSSLSVEKGLVLMFEQSVVVSGTVKTQTLGLKFESPERIPYVVQAKYSSDDEKWHITAEEYTKLQNVIRNPYYNEGVAILRVGNNAGFPDFEFVNDVLNIRLTYMERYNSPNKLLITTYLFDADGTGDKSGKFITLTDS